MRAHRPIRQLALALADMGYHVLRFDYRGSGDSAGSMDGLDTGDWIEGVKLAIEELRDIAAIRKISVIGLRLGGLMATLAACEDTQINRLVLWDPVSSGDVYVERLKQDLPELPIEAAKANFIDSEQTIHVIGFSMPVKFQQSLQSLGLAALDISPITSVLQLVSHQSRDFTQLKEAWSGYQNFTYQLHPAPHDWSYVDNVGGILFPLPIMTAIKTWFLED
jgi:pimeloyl-ACP methyl ester carboxylesterase